MPLFEIDKNDIYFLDELQLHEVLKRLLFLETEKHGIDVSTIQVSLTPKQRDGGEDGTISWNHSTKNRTSFLPNKLVFFQCKKRQDPGKFAKTQCINELIYKKDEKIIVKERINTLFQNNGTYILFCNFPCTSKMKDDRIEGFREGLRRAGAPYTQTCDIQVYGGEEIADWVNEFISAVIFIRHSTGRGIIPLGMTNWDDWSSYNDNKTKYFPDERINEKITALREYFSSSQRIGRIIGLSGLGKTRLALEAFRPPENYADNVQQYQLSQKVVYFNAREINDNILPIITNWRQNGLSGLLIVDECDCDLHDKLSRQVEHEHSDLSLLTIDFSDDCGIRENALFKMEPVENSVIENIIYDTFPKLPKEDVDRIVEISQGFPLMAVLIAKDRSFGAKNVGIITKKTIIDRLIGGRNGPSQLERDVISACSLFTAFRAKGEEPLHTDYIAQRICRGIDPDIFSRTLIKVKNERGIVNEAGRCFSVIPKPLAITLATDWWKNCSLREAEQLLLGEDLPKGLVNPLCDQFKYIKLIPEIQSLSEELCGVQSPFGQAEILNSVRGSRIFRSLAEVNPPAAVTALYRCFGHADKTTLQQVGPGRRNLIWALENLCFWESTFPQAAYLMLKFAVAETEKGLGNNATEQFYQLFHYLLSGTQAPPKIRLTIIDQGLTTNDLDFQIICITALGHALRTYGFHRTGSVETQGSKYPEKDWVPRIWQEVFDYWKEALLRLKEYAMRTDDLGELAQKQIVDSIPGMLRYGQLDVLEDTIFSICDVKGYFWPEVTSNLKWFIEHNNKIPKKGKKRIQGWISKLEPKTIKDKTYTIVIQPEEFKVRSGINWHDEINNKIDTFVGEVAQDPAVFCDVLNLLLRTKSTGGYRFGFQIKTYIKDYKNFLQTTLDILKSIPKEQRDISVLSGFIFAIRHENSKLVDDCFEKIAKDPQLDDILVHLTAATKPEIKDLLRLVELLNRKRIRVESLSILSYGNTLSSINSEDIVLFLKEILSSSKKGCPVVLDLAYMYTFKDEEKFQYISSFLKTILTTNRCFFKVIKNTPGRRELFCLEDLILSLLKEGKSDLNFAEYLTRELINLCAESSITTPFSWDLRNIIEELVSPQYADVTWPIFSKAIIKGNFRTTHRLKDLFYFSFARGKERTNLLEKLPFSALTKWCEENPKKAPYFLSIAVSPIHEQGEGTTWSKIGLYLLDQFGNDKKVLDGLSSNIYTFSWSGSMISAYKNRLKAFISIETHKNPNVRIWAENNIEYLRNEIKKESDSEEEEIFRR